MGVWGLEISLQGSATPWSHRVMVLREVRRALWWVSGTKRSKCDREGREASEETHKTPGQWVHPGVSITASTSSATMVGVFAQRTAPFWAKGEPSPPLSNVQRPKGTSLTRADLLSKKKQKNGATLSDLPSWLGQGVHSGSLAQHPQSAVP